MSLLNKWDQDEENFILFPCLSQICHPNPFIKTTLLGWLILLIASRGGLLLAAVSVFVFETVSPCG